MFLYWKILPSVQPQPVTYKGPRIWIATAFSVAAAEAIRQESYPSKFWGEMISNLEFYI